MGADTERGGLNGVDSGKGVLYPCFLDIAYPDCINLGTGVLFTGIRFLVYVAVVVLTSPVVP